VRFSLKTRITSVNNCTRSCF